MAIERSELRPQVGNFGRKINTPQGKEFFVVNNQKVTLAPKSVPKTPNQVGKAWKQSKI